MTSPDTLKALAAEFNRYFTSSNGIDVGERVSVPRDEWRKLFAILESLASADEGVPDEREAFEASSLGKKLLLGKYLDGDEYINGVTSGAWRGWQARAALSAQSTAADEMAVALKAVCNYLSGSQTRDIGTDQAALSEVRAALAAHEAKHGGKG